MGAFDQVILGSDLWAVRKELKLQEDWLYVWDRLDDLDGSKFFAYMPKRTSSRLRYRHPPQRVLDRVTHNLPARPMAMVAIGRTLVVMRETAKQSKLLCTLKRIAVRRGDCTQASRKYSEFCCDGAGHALRQN